MQYTYPAILEQEDGLYNVTFPDLPECYTSGDDLTDALHQATDVLSDVLCDYEDQNRAVPIPTDPAKIATSSGCIVVSVYADTDIWRKICSTKQ